jgi:NIPSNAP
MIYEMRTYSIEIGQAQQYIKIFEEIGLPIISKYNKLVGYWFTEIGELNQLVHIWEFESLEDRSQKRSALNNDPEWLEKFLPLARPLLVKQENKIMLPASFSPIR